MDRTDSGFRVVTAKRDEKRVYEVPAVVLATGYYDNPHLMNIPGEESDHVHHYFHDAHPYADQNVVVIGGRNSAIDVALDLHHVGANVTMVYRREQFSPSVKAWVKPVIEAAIEKGRVKMYWGSEVKEIKPNSVVIEQNEKQIEIPADTVFAMTGYRPNLEPVRRLGGKIDEDTGVPYLTEAMETTIPGLYLAGVVATGHDSTKIFIENGRHHGRMIARDLRRKRS
jgi:thioredoxin reductase (NADPH)